MLRQPISWIAVKVEVADAYDGMMRLLLDAQRFGFTLRDVAAEVRADGSAGIRMVMGTNGAAGCSRIAERFSRHPTVSTAIAIEMRDERDGDETAPATILEAADFEAARD